MTSKHFFPSTDGLVDHALHAHAARNPALRLDGAHRVLSARTHTASRMALVAGGGSGHEPCWAGLVGDGMLAASVSGDVFASPSAKQIAAALHAVPSDVGTLVCITNYTGDVLHAGLAREKAVAAGRTVDVVCLGEDAALARSQVGATGRRGLAGNVLVIKLLGAAAHGGWSYDQCLQLGREGNQQLATVVTSLDHCHVPGRKSPDQVPNDACVLGMGKHNEPGLRTISPIPSPERLVDEMFKYLLDTSDDERGYVEFSPDDAVAILVNNMGGLSDLELAALADVALLRLVTYKITPVRVYIGTFETSLNAPGFSITLANISGIASSTSRSVSAILGLLDAPTMAPAWPGNYYSHTGEARDAGASQRTPKLKASVESQNTSSFESMHYPAELKMPMETLTGPHLAPTKLVSALRKACTRALAAEPEITAYDTQMGDGDCGEAVVGVCQSILSKLDALSSPPPRLLALLADVTESIEDVGGTFGALLSILVTAFLHALSSVTESSPASPEMLSVDTVAQCARTALDGLMRYTAAREGDRTLMDVLIPFVGEFSRSENVVAAAQVAKERAESTKMLKPKFGRAAYVGEGAKESVPDAGAWAVAVWLQGFVEEW